MITDLKTLYKAVSGEIARIDFSRLWPGFLPLRFAVYNESECCFDGEMIEKTPAFCANTSIEYEGEQIAIWNVMEEMDPSVFASKMVHEMFHGFQNVRGWGCFPNDVEALMRYENSAEALSIKLRENALLTELLECHDEDKLNELLALRRSRLMRFPYETEYEAMTEEIEGSANYVEWKVLEQLAPERAEALKRDMRERLTDPSRLLPARIPCYYTGALFINALAKAGRFDHEAEERPYLLSLIRSAEPAEVPDTAVDPAAAEAVRSYDAETERIINAALERGNAVLHGPLTLVCPNIYNARRLGEYITSTFFIMYADGEENKLAYGDFVVKMSGERTIEEAFEWPKED